MTGFAIIGDVHGCADEFTTLLQKLGYSARDGPCRHPGDRQAVFVGDLIDRGPSQVASVTIPRAKAEHGTAQIVIGNREFNAVAFATLRADDSDWCRPHTDKNTRQRSAFINAVGFGSPNHRSTIDWLDNFQSGPISAVSGWSTPVGTTPRLPTPRLE